MTWNDLCRPIGLYFTFVLGLSCLLVSIQCTSDAYSDELPLTSKEILKLRNDVKSMFYHAYNGYMEYAIPYDELRPLTCDGHDTWGSYSLTLIDALDTLAVMENKTEFQRVYSLISQRTNFESDINVSVFETNIRIVGGLISGHLLARRMGVNVEEGWPCKGRLLTLAVDAATRLLPAFDTPTGMPYGTVNLKYGVPDQETPVTCAAGVGTFIIEFGTLSRLTGDPLFEEVALRALHALWERRSRLNLIGNHIDVLTGHWTGSDAGIGAGVDSFFEYLVKGSFLFQRPELMEMFRQARRAVDNHLRHDDWYLWKSMQRGQITMAVFQSLEAFWPGVLTLVGDIDAAQKTLYNYHQVMQQYGFHPEFYSIPQAMVYSKRSGYPLRPEFVESLMYLYQATKDHTFLKMGADLLVALEHSTKTKCGYATVDNVVDHTLDNRMESFFLAETTKYLYLLFNEDHWLHDTGQKGRPLKVGERFCVVEAGGYFFNTEAHPIDAGALACCSFDGKDFAFSQEDIVNLVLDPTVFVARHGGRPLTVPLGRGSGSIRGDNRESRKVVDEKMKVDNVEVKKELRKEVNVQEDKMKVDDVQVKIDELKEEVEEDIEKVLEKEAEMRVMVQDGMKAKSGFMYNTPSTVKKVISVGNAEIDREPAPIKETEGQRREPAPTIGADSSSETVKGAEPLIKTILEEEKDGNESEYEGSISGIPWGPRFTAASTTGGHKGITPGGEMTGVATSVSSSKFSLRTESRIVQKEVESDTKKRPRKEFNLGEFRSGARDFVRILASNWTDKVSPSVLSCPVTFVERFSFKGQMIGA